MSNLTIAAIPPAMIDVVWNQLAPLLEKPIDLCKDETSLDYIYGFLKAGLLMALVVCENDKIIAVNVLRVDTFDNGNKLLFIVLVGGERIDEWGYQVLDAEKEIAKSLGCVELRGCAVRNGWLRKLNKTAWQEVHTVIKLKLGE
jgi:hypothetical protein